jgi:hypothetical protein
MKIRIKGNSLRYRLTQTDMALLAGKGAVEEKINFGTSTLVYELISSPEPVLSAAFTGNRISMHFPAAWVEEWVGSNKTGYRHTTVLNETDTILLLVEKDFTCLDKADEDQSDNYPHPQLNK